LLKFIAYKREPFERPLKNNMKKKLKQSLFVYYGSVHATKHTGNGEAP
jgi:hypothetical protein